MSPVRLTIGFLLLFVLPFTAERGVADDLDQQIAERTRQYQESLRQRAAEISPSFQVRIESQAKQTVAVGLEQWQKGELDIRIALPHWIESQRAARFVAQHLPGLPTGSLIWGTSGYAAAFTVTSVQLVLKSPAIHTANAATMRSAVCPFQQSGEGISYFIRVARTIVQRR